MTALPSWFFVVKKKTEIVQNTIAPGSLIDPAGSSIDPVGSSMSAPGSSFDPPGSSIDPPGLIFSHGKHG